MEKNSVRVEILGSSFSIQSNGDTQHLKRVADYLSSKIREIQVKYCGNIEQDPIKISLLAGLNIVDELFRCQRQNSTAADGDRENAEIERGLERVIDAIDRSLLGN